MQLRDGQVVDGTAFYDSISFNGLGDRVEPVFVPGSSGGRSYSIRIPEMARAITSCWICSVPSKMS